MREQSHEVGGLIIEFSTRGTKFFDVINDVSFSLILFSSKCFGNGGIYKILSNGLGRKSLSVYRAYFFWTPNASTCVDSCSNSSLEF